MPAIPRGFGDRTAAQRVYRRLLRENSQASAARTVGGAELELSLSDWPQAQAFLLGRYDPSTAAFIIDHLPTNGVFVEGGSHIGLIASQVAAARPNATIHCFEPHPEKFPALEQNLARNAATAVVNNVGLSDREDEIAYDSDRHSIDESASDSIPVRTLDGYAEERGIESIDVLKLDVEGHELEALIGAHALLESGRIKAITMESLHGETSQPIEYLLDLGFREVPMPDTRPAWVVRLREMPVENIGFVCRRYGASSD